MTGKPRNPIRLGDYIITPPISKFSRDTPRDSGIVVGAFNAEVSRQRYLVVSFDSSRHPMRFAPEEVTTIEYEWSGIRAPRPPENI